MNVDFGIIAGKKLDEFCNAIKKGIPLEKCEDQHVGKISSFRLKQKDFERKPVKGDMQRGKCLIMILESPHVDEFKGIVSPAKGATGSSIRAHIRNVVDSIMPDDYELILMNAIQYQCSLGMPTECVRDQIFLEIWEKLEGNQDFGRRLAETAREGDVIVNCCTIGNDKERKLRNLVQEAIDKLRPSLEAKGVKGFYRRTHPSSWGRSGAKAQLYKLDKDWEWSGENQR